jgi:hypothetical protein
MNLFSDFLHGVLFPSLDLRSIYGGYGIRAFRLRR